MTLLAVIRHSIVASIPACHAGDRGSIPRDGALLHRFLHTPDCQQISWNEWQCIVTVKQAWNERTVPTLIGEEKKANPFLRADFSEEIRKNVGVTDSDSPADAFGKVRKAKDNF